MLTWNQKLWKNRTFLLRLNVYFFYFYCVKMKLASKFKSHKCGNEPQTHQVWSVYVQVHVHLHVNVHVHVNGRCVYCTFLSSAHVIGFCSFMLIVLGWAAGRSGSSQQDVGPAGPRSSVPLVNSHDLLCAPLAGYPTSDEDGKKHKRNKSHYPKSKQHIRVFRILLFRKVVPGLHCQTLKMTSSFFFRSAHFHPDATL